MTIKAVIPAHGELVFSSGVKLTAFPIKSDIYWLGPIEPPQPPEDKL